MNSPHDKQFEIGGVFRCCIEQLRVAELPESVPVGYVVPCHGCDGMRWTGEVWQAAWIARDYRHDDLTATDRNEAKEASDRA